MGSNRIALLLVGVLGIAATAAAAPPVFTAPLPYQSVSDSPYFGDGEVCFALETFPNGEPSAFGYQFNSQTGAEIVPGVGVPPGGHVLQANDLGVIELSFSPPVFEAGFVWTGGATIGSTITLTVISGTEAVTQQYADLPPNAPDDPSTNLFFGVSWDTGVEILRITFLPFGPAVPNQIDDIQYNSGAQPLGAPSLISPSNEATNATPTFIWVSDPCATWYQLWVNDSTGVRVNKWYQASEVDAASGICTVTPAVGLLNGNGAWWIRSWNQEFGSGPWSDVASFTIDASFGPPTPLSPAGVTSTNYPLFTWQPVPDATWYQLWVNDSTGTPIRQWFTAEEVQASSGTCRIAPGIALATGNCTWWVKSWNEQEGNSYWSPGKTFQAGVWGVPVLAAPTGSSVASPTYLWQPVAEATWYQLWVEDSTGVRVNVWLTEEQVGAATGQCSSTPEATLNPGDSTWWVRPWNKTRGYGPWSPGTSFSVE